MKDSSDDTTSMKDFMLSVLNGIGTEVPENGFFVSENVSPYSTGTPKGDINIFKFLIENSSDGLAYFEGENLIYASPVYEKMLGYAITPDKFPTLSHILRFVHPDDFKHVVDEIRGGEERGLLKQTYRFRQQKSDRTYRWFENSITRHYDGSKIKTYVISRDIEDRMQKEIELRRSEERFKALFSQNAIGFVTSDLSGRITDANRMFHSISGYSPEILKHQFFNALIHQDDKESVSDLISKSIENHLGENPLELRIISKSGAIVWVEIFANPIKYRNGTPDCLVIAVNDITWRREAEKTLHRNRTMLEAIADNTAALIFAKDTYGRFTFINKAFENNFGLKMSEIIGKTDFDLFGEELSRVYQQNDQAVMSGDKPCVFEEEVEKDGLKTTAISIKVPLFDHEGKVSGLCGIASDISNLKDKERELQEVISTKEKLLSIISHDLVNPLNSLYGFAQILHTGFGKSSPEATERNINMVLKSSKAITELINTLQQWAVLQKNKISVSPVQIQLWELVESTFTLLESPARNKNIRLANQISRELQAFADEKMMDVVFRNILSNAVKFSNSGGQIVVSSFCANGHTTISIKDFGVGIPEAILQNLFSIKGADSQPGTAGEMGTGLGLLISKEFVELNGGKIWATSQPGNGSEFCVELPVKE